MYAPGWCCHPSSSLGQSAGVHHRSRPRRPTAGSCQHSARLGGPSGGRSCHCLPACAHQSMRMEWNDVHTITNAWHQEDKNVPFRLGVGQQGHNVGSHSVQVHQVKCNFVEATHPLALSPIDGEGTATTSSSSTMPAAVVPSMVWHARTQIKYEILDPQSRTCTRPVCAPPLYRYRQASIHISTRTRPNLLQSLTANTSSRQRAERRAPRRLLLIEARCVGDRPNRFRSPLM